MIGTRNWVTLFSKKPLVPVIGTRNWVTPFSKKPLVPVIGPVENRVGLFLESGIAGQWCVQRHIKTPRRLGRAKTESTQTVIMESIG
jgi:hypothetical protein